MPKHTRASYRNGHDNNPISTPEQALEPDGRRAVGHCPDQLDAEPLIGEIEGTSSYFDYEERLLAPWRWHGTRRRQRL